MIVVPTLLWQVLVLLALLAGASTSEAQATSSSSSNCDNSKQKNDEFRSLDLNTPSRKLTELMTVELLETKQQNMSAPTQPTTTASFNATAFSFTACEKIDMAFQFITSLDFDEHFHKALSASPTATASESDFFGTVYLLQWILMPISLVLLLFGASFFLHTCVLCAAAGGLFTVFGFVDTLLPMGLDCPMKLALSIVAAFVSALMATAFFRFALFSFGALAVGGVAYVIFDTFPQLDPGVVYFSTTSTGSQEQQQQQQLPTGDLSTLAWIVTIFLGGGGGMLLRYYEQATLEIITAGMGGVGCAYSIHTFLLLNQIILDPSVVFLLAFFISVGGTYPILSYLTMLLVLYSPRMDEILIIVFNAAIISERNYFCFLILTFSSCCCCLRVWMFRAVHSAGCKFQRRRRLHLYARVENHDGQQLPTMMHPMTVAAEASQQQQLQLEQSLRGLLQFQTNEKSSRGASSEQMIELTQSVNKFLENMELGQKDKSDKES